MSNLTEDRFCPLCDQFVSRDTEGVSVPINRMRKVMLHMECASEVYKAFLNKFKEEKAEG